MLAIIKLSIKSQEICALALGAHIELKHNLKILTILQDTAAIIGMLIHYVLFSSSRYVRDAILVGFGLVTKIWLADFPMLEMGRFCFGSTFVFGSSDFVEIPVL
jgi:hypothetical protein